MAVHVRPLGIHETVVKWVCILLLQPSSAILLATEKQGFHRFHFTHLESNSVPLALVKYWTGHAKSSDGTVVRSTITDRYVQMVKDVRFRMQVAERIGLGFELPTVEMVEVVPNVPNFQKTEVAVSD